MQMKVFTLNSCGVQARLHLYPWLLAGCLGAASCISPRPSDLDFRGEPAVVLKTVNISNTVVPFYAAFAHHAWIELRESGSGNWTLLEINSGVQIKTIGDDLALANERWSTPVRVLASWHGDEAARLIPLLLEATRDEIDANEELSPDPSEQARRKYWARTYSTPYPNHPWRLDYESWPGPNSNTFVANLLRAVPGMGAELDHNSVGKDWVEGLRLGRTDDGLGVEVDATFLGAAIGLYQGLELHMIGLTAGVSFWPPSLKIPFLPRLGVHPGWVRARW